MARDSYPNLSARYDWPEGVHKAPAGYEHSWLVVTEDGTVGCWSRAEAREVWRDWSKHGRPVEA